MSVGPPPHHIKERANSDDQYGVCLSIDRLNDIALPLIRCTVTQLFIEQVIQLLLPIFERIVALVPVCLLELNVEFASVLNNFGAHIFFDGDQVQELHIGLFSCNLTEHFLAVNHRVKRFKLHDVELLVELPAVVWRFGAHFIRLIF